MFNRRKAYIIYNELLDDLIESKKALQQEDNFFGISSGFVIASKKYASKKTISNLERLAINDNYNFTVLDLPGVNNKKDLVIYSIDNEPKDLKVKRIGENNRIFIRR